MLSSFHVPGGEDEEEGEDGMWDSTPKGGRKGMGLGPSICLLTTKACGQGITLTGERTADSLPRTLSYALSPIAIPVAAAVVSSK